MNTFQNITRQTAQQDKSDPVCLQFMIKTISLYHTNHAPLTDWIGSTTTATALSDRASKLCWVLISTPESQQPKPGWEWYQPTTISGRPTCFNMSNILAWKTGSTASTDTPWKKRNRNYSKLTPLWLPLNYLIWKTVSILWVSNEFITVAKTLFKLYYKVFLFCIPLYINQFGLQPQMI